MRLRGSLVFFGEELVGGVEVAAVELVRYYDCHLACNFRGEV